MINSVLSSSPKEAGHCILKTDHLSRMKGGFGSVDLSVNRIPNILRARTVPPVYYYISRRKSLGASAEYQIIPIQYGPRLRRNSGISIQ